MTRIKTFLTKFARREDGTIAMEAMIIMPMMFWCFLSVFSIFETFRTYSINQKAAFTIGDVISRETNPLDDSYLDGVHDLFEYLSNSQGNTRMRVSALRWDSNDDRFYLIWSETRGSMPELLDGDVETWDDRLPAMPHNEQIMLVETWSTYDPPFATGLEQREIENFVFTRPRFAPRVCWENCT